VVGLGAIGFLAERGGKDEAEAPATARPAAKGTAKPVPPRTGGGLGTPVKPK
jgi:hypothetical protein